MDRLHQFFQLTLRVLLGIFVLWQAVFLCGSFLANCGKALASLGERQDDDAPFLARHGIVFRRPSPFVEELSKQSELVLRRYSELTGQRQRWKLYAPDAYDYFDFIAVQLRWDDEGLPEGSVPVHNLQPVVLGSKIEPANLERYVRLGGMRMRRYETILVPEETIPESMYSVQARKTGEHPETPPPSQVILLLRRYRIPAPPGPSPWDWEFEGQFPLARWVPSKDE